MMKVFILDDPWSFNHLSADPERLTLFLLFRIPSIEIFALRAIFFLMGISRIKNSILQKKMQKTAIADYSSSSSDSDFD